MSCSSFSFILLTSRVFSSKDVIFSFFSINSLPSSSIMAEFRSIFSLHVGIPFLSFLSFASCSSICLST
uniref:Uncharacterized protein n=1 Tax=Arundo donax TaxID=35708 RepID=A0A0A9A7H1_ARUDO